MNKILVDQSVIEQALEALGRIHFAATELDRRNRVRWFDDAVDEAKEAITALRTALEHPVRTKDLTDDEIAVIVRKAAIGYAINRDGLTSHRIARAAIAADREKNNV